MGSERSSFDASSDSTELSVGLARVAEGEFSPTGFAVPPDDGEYVFLVDQFGVVRVLEDESLRDEPFLDVRDRVVDLYYGHDERGLLGLAFHPDYAENRRFYVRYSAPPREGTPDGWNHTEVLSEFRATEDGERAEPGSERVLLEIPHPGAHHNAGDLAFGPDGYLYVGMGDGGNTGDTGPGHVEGGNAQDVTENVLGSVLRIDVDQRDGDRQFGIPDDNPLVGREGIDELYAWGLRNPYQLSFDDDGRLFAGEELLPGVS